MKNSEPSGCNITGTASTTDITNNTSLSEEEGIFETMPKRLSKKERSSKCENGQKNQQKCKFAF